MAGPTSRRLLGRAGNVLVHVLIASVVATVLAVSLAQMLLARYATTAKVTSQSQGQRRAEGSLNRVITAWNTGGICSAVPGYTCTPAGTGPCGTGASYTCTCTPNPACACPTGTDTDPGRCDATIIADTSGGRCRLRMTTCQ